MGCGRDGVCSGGHGLTGLVRGRIDSCAHSEGEGSGLHVLEKRVNIVQINIEKITE